MTKDTKSLQAKIAAGLQGKKRKLTISRLRATARRARNAAHRPRR